MGLSLIEEMPFNSAMMIAEHEQLPGCSQQSHQHLKFVQDRS
jgi:hypothetical protein